MSIGDLMRGLLDGGLTSLAVIGLAPVAIGSLSLMLMGQGKKSWSQLVANIGILIGLVALLLMVCSMIWGSMHGMSLIEDVPVLWFVAPFYLLIAGFVVENRVHPGEQEGVRAKMRGALLIVIVLALLFWLLARMRVWMMVHTGVMGLLMFLAAIVGLLYYLVRKAI